MDAFDTILKNRGFIYSIIRGMGVLPQDEEDVYHDAILNLAQNFHQFDPERGNYLKWARFYIMNSITRYRANADGFSEWYYRIVVKIRKAINCNGGTIDIDQIERVSGVPKDQIMDFIHIINPKISLPDQTYPLLFEDDFSKKCNFNLGFHEMLEQLPAKQKMIIQLTYGIDCTPLTTREMTQYRPLIDLINPRKTKISTSAIYQNRSQAIKKIREIYNDYV